MNNTAKRERKIRVLWVDHDSDIAGFLKKISQNRDLVTRARVADCCDFIPVIVDFTPSANNKGTPLEERIELEIRKLEKDGVDVILVDLSYGPHMDPGEVKVGWGIARYLQQTFQNSAVGVYTKDVLSPTHRALICGGGFDLILEDFVKMIERQDALAAGTWTTLFSDVVSRIKNRSARFPTSRSFEHPNMKIEWTPGHPKSTSPAFRKYAPVLVAKALADIPDLKTIKLSQLGGGFSGSYLVKVEPQGGQKTFVVKIDESPERLRREYSGYAQMGAFLSQRHVIKLEGEPVALADDMWGALAMEYDGKRKPLVECEPLTAQDLIKIYTAIWNECLFKPYGALTCKQVEPSDIVKNGSRKAANSSIEGCSRYLDRTRRLNNAALPWIEKGLQWLSAGPDATASGKSLSVPYAERVHGDLNCRNVFFAKEEPAILFIDFPNVRPASLATDFVKAESELVAVMMDRASGEDCEHSRLDEWKRLTDASSRGLSPTFSDLNDKELERIAIPIGIIRKTYQDKAASVGGDYNEAYRLALVARLLPYLGYPDVTAAKKLLLLAWIGQLVGTTW